MDINKINGYEIIDFLNNLDEDTKDTLSSEYNFETPIEFEKQYIFDGRYRLEFSVYHNNWGTNQIINDNVIEIFKNGRISVGLEEPLDGNGCEEILEQQIALFLKNHTFNENVEDDFYRIIENCRDNLNSLAYSDKELLENTIEQLTKANSMIK
jgi:hypothetical protein